MRVVYNVFEAGVERVVSAARGRRSSGQSRKLALDTVLRNIGARDVLHHAAVHVFNAIMSASFRKA